MAEPVFMPKLGLYMEDVALVDWFVSEGQRVGVGETLFELETDKTTSEVEAEVEGICHLLIPRGTRTPIGTVVALIAASPAEYQSLLGDPDQQASSGFAEAAADPESVSEHDALTAAPLAVRKRDLATQHSRTCRAPNDGEPARVGSAHLGAGARRRRADDAALSLAASQRRAGGRLYRVLRQASR